MMLKKRRCKSCGRKVRPVLIENNIAYCPNCGYKHFLSAEELRREQYKDVHDSSFPVNLERMKVIAVVAGAFVAALCITLAVHGIYIRLFHEASEKRGEVPRGSCEQFLDIPVDAAVEHLEILGMTNIVKIELNDVFVWPHKRGKVQYISIAGKTKFGKHFHARTDDQVILRYYKSFHTVE